MSKYVMFSFDDGRKDQYEDAYHVLKKYGFPATINIVSEFINEPSSFDIFKTCDNESVTWKNLEEMSADGWEIACHGATHKNTVEDIEKWFADIQITSNNWDRDIGFASPGSFLTIDNAEEVINLKDEGKLLYIRSGKRTRREGMLYAISTILNNQIHSKRLFYHMNKDCILTKRETILKAVGVTKDNTVDELMYLIEKLKDEEAVILMFHSIKKRYHDNRDKWYWGRDQLEQLCYKLSKYSDIEICTTRKWWENV